MLGFRSDGHTQRFLSAHGAGQQSVSIRAPSAQGIKLPRATRACIPDLV
jgi:hypothetical protein